MKNPYDKTNIFNEKTKCEANIVRTVPSVSQINREKRYNNTTNI